MGARVWIIHRNSDAAFVRKYSRICSQIPPKFDLLTFAHTSLRLPILTNEPKGSIL